jgi:hypothetical protein
LAEGADFWVSLQDQLQRLGRHCSSDIPAAAVVICCGLELEQVLVSAESYSN